VYSLKTGAEVHRLQLRRPLLHLSASADARFVGAIDESGALRLWSWPDFAPVHEMPSEAAAGSLH
jgi:hypothetical protein